MERIKRTGSLYDDNITGIEDLNDFFEIDYWQSLLLQVTIKFFKNKLFYV
jgi:hypothetical protein